MRVLVTGGAGFIGSHTVLELVTAGHRVVVVDNLDNAKPLSPRRALTGRPLDFHTFDLTDPDKTEHLFAHAIERSSTSPASRPSARRRAAAGVLREQPPARTSRWCAMRRTGCTLVFSSSATVYGDPERVPIDEDLPTSATNPYGGTKLMQEDICATSPGRPAWRIALLRYFNPVGAHARGPIGEDPRGIPNNLMPFITQVAVGRREKLSVYGDDSDARRHRRARLHPRRRPRRRPRRGHRRLGDTDARSPPRTSAPAPAPRCWRWWRAFERAGGHELPTSRAPPRRRHRRLVRRPQPGRGRARLAATRTSTTCAPTRGAGRAGTPQGYPDA